MMQRRSDPQIRIAALRLSLNAAHHSYNRFVAYFSVRCHRRFLSLFLLLSLSFLVVAAQAANTPCSGRKGGISHCAGDTFVCNDGSVSASRKSCSVYTGQSGGGNMRGLMGSQGDSTASDCSCRSHTYCTGPRGGRYCMTDGGTKSYLRR